METALWIAASVLAFVFFASGVTKLFQSRQRLHDSGMTYVEDFPAGVVKAIGAAEVLAALALLLPGVFDAYVGLVPVAALGLAVLMIGAVVVHIRRGEPFVAPVALAGAALVLAVLRFDVYAL